MTGQRSSKTTVRDCQLRDFVDVDGMASSVASSIAIKTGIGNRNDVSWERVHQDSILIVVERAIIDGKVPDLMPYASAIHGADLCPNESDIAHGETGISN